MECGIVGLPNVGKSTLFNALTAAGIEAANYPFCTIEPNVGIVEVPDPRLARIEAKIPTQKVIPAAVRLVDIAGIVKGASEGEGLGNKFLSHIREVDAILHVVRCFEDADITHVDGSVDPVRDADVIETELILADLSVCENGVDKARRQARTGDKEWAARLELLQRCQAHLEAAQPIRGMELTEDEERTLRGYGFITAKRVIFIANVDESGLAEESPPTAALRDHANNTGAGMVKVCAKIESELAELDDETKAEMLADLGMDEPALHKVTRAAYALLGLQSYFTAGEKEIRAWTIPIGATAPQAAGVIHTDFERGFIRAECFSLDDLEHHDHEKGIREAGKLRSEGKTYVVADGDIIHFLFNV